MTIKSVELQYAIEKADLIVKWNFKKWILVYVMPPRLH
jgi:hypothetical protein